MTIGNVFRLPGTEADALVTLCRIGPEDVPAGVKDRAEYWFIPG